MVSLNEILFAFAFADKTKFLLMYYCTFVLSLLERKFVSIKRLKFRMYCLLQCYLHILQII